MGSKTSARPLVLGSKHRFDPSYSSARCVCGLPASHPIHKGGAVVTLDEHNALRDWCVRFGVFVGLLAGGELYAVGGWLMVGAAAAIALLVGLGGLFLYAWQDAQRRWTDDLEVNS